MINCRTYRINLHSDLSPRSLARMLDFISQPLELIETSARLLHNSIYFAVQLLPSSPLRLQRRVTCLIHCVQESRQNTPQCRHCSHCSWRREAMQWNTLKGLHPALECVFVKPVLSLKETTPPIFCSSDTEPRERPYRPDCFGLVSLRLLAGFSSLLRRDPNRNADTNNSSDSLRPCRGAFASPTLGPYRPQKSTDCHKGQSTHSQQEEGFSKPSRPFLHTRLHFLEAS